MNYTDEQIELIVSKLKSIDQEELFDEILNETILPIKVLYEYQPSDVLKNVDPIAYRVECANYIDSLIGETLTDEVNGEFYNLNDVNDLLEQLTKEQV